MSLKTFYWHEMTQINARTYVECATRDAGDETRHHSMSLVLPYRKLSLFQLLLYITNELRWCVGSISS